MTQPGRKFAQASSGYKYSINGQEKSEELGENLTTAMYWEYDSRITRRWNLDPKPKIGTSYYSVFDNNPIAFNDLLGDTAIIQIGKNAEIRYVGNKWIDSKTREDANTSKYSATTIDLMNSYSKLNTISEVNEVTTKINNSPVNIELTSTKRGSETFVGNYLKGLSGNTLKINLSSKITTIAGKENWTEKPLKLPKYIALGHELGHAFDVLNNKPQSHFEELSGPVFGVLLIKVAKSEINATYWENILRIHANLDIRVQYGSSSNRNIIIDENETLKTTRDKNYKPIKREIFDTDGRAKEVFLK